MKIEQMPGYHYLTLSVWPQPCYKSGKWLMYEYKYIGDGSLKWYLSYIEREPGAVFPDVYDSYQEAVQIAKIRNQTLRNNLNTLNLPAEKTTSLRLKVEKAITAKNRLLSEEQTMLNEGIRRHQASSKEHDYEIIVDNRYQSLIPPLSKILRETPYIKIARLHRYGTTLLRKGKNDWTTFGKHTKQTAKYYYRERIAAAYGFDGTDHWGETKAKIRKLLLPRANELLQEASIKRILADALAKGRKVVVLSGFVFWFEEEGELGWIIKEANYTQVDKRGNTLWIEGRIISKNHGRIVVLPYIKENREFVNGHTKNAPNDGKAKPRHSEDYLELPFEILEDDLMIGLFGELKYE